MKIEDVFKESFNIDIVALADETTLMSFDEWDSMSHMFFITKLEEAYEMELSGDEIADMQTIGNVKKILLSRGKNE